MIQKVQIAGNLRERFGAEFGPFEFGPRMNLIVGPNGSGKSTLLRAIHEKTTSKLPGLFSEAVVTRTDERPVLYWTSEDNGIRLRSYFSDDLDMVNQVQAIYASRGQAQGSYLVRWLIQHKEKIKAGAVVLIDEPDVTLDARNAADILLIMRQLPAQSIIAVHHPYLVMQKAETVIELEPGYIKLVKKQMQDLLEQHEERSKAHDAGA